MLKYLDEYRDTGLCLAISDRIKKISTRPFRIMEVCGGHTMSIRKNGIHRLVGEHIRLISGPGCPVCVTSTGDIDKVVAVSGIKGVSLCTFGDLFNVPGSSKSLAASRAEGDDVRIVYSAHDALKFAESEPDKYFVFASIGFETTAPTAAAAIIEAGKKNLRNFKVLALNKTMPNALAAVLSDKNSKIEALICPGHVSTITGYGIYTPIVSGLKIPCCISGFEPADILKAIYALVEMHEKSKAALVNAYERAVRPEGNVKARSMMDEVFEPCDVAWRGLGVIPGSGLKIRERYSEFDAEKCFDIAAGETKEDPRCICGDILRGAKEPRECALFGKTCTPELPRGACMVSSEGTCAAWYKYGGS